MPQGNSEYTIQKGDTLSKIARRFGITDYHALATLNGIENPNLIFEGAVLKLPVATDASETTSPKATTQASAHPAHRPLTGASEDNLVPPTHLSDSNRLHSTGSISALRSAIVKEAERHVGILETGGDNMGRAIQAYRQHTGAQPGAAWCADFISHVQREATAPFLPHGVDLLEPKQVALALENQFRSKNAYHPASSDYTPKPGDLIFFSRGTESWQGHAGIVTEIDKNGIIHTIEGNKAPLEFRGNPNYKWSPENPDGVRRVTYTPDQLHNERIRGYGNIASLIANKDIALTTPPEDARIAQHDKGSRHPGGGGGSSIRSTNLNR